MIPGHPREGDRTPTIIPNGPNHELKHDQFKKLLTPGKIGQILCLGNLTDRETYEYLRTIAPDLQLVKGDFDIENPYPSSSSPNPSSVAGASSASSSSSSTTSIPLSKVITHGSLRIGFTHGHTIIPQGDADALLIAARQMDVDVLLWGGTHRFEAYELEGKFFVNPGSGTGAMSTGWGWGAGGGGEKGGEEGEEEAVPSFCLMDVSLLQPIPLTFWVGFVCWWGSAHPRRGRAGQGATD